MGVSKKAKRESKIAIVNVGEVREKALNSTVRRNLDFIHHPALNDPSHSGIHNLRPNNDIIAELILQTVPEHEIYPRS